MEKYIELRKAAGRLDEDAWLELCARASESPTAIDGVPLPTSPSAEAQASFVGSSGKQAIAAAGQFYKYAIAANRKFRGEAIGKLLDFGCGWGRFTRLFLRDVPESGIYAVDPNPAAVQLCRLHVPYACFVNSDWRPPLPFRDQFFDVVVAYSVFSHLSEINAATWIYEISRILRPGGILVATTHAPWLLDWIEQMQQGKVPAETRWHSVLVRSWPDIEAARSQYRAGRFLFSEAGEYADGYGDALVPEEYVRKVWGALLEPKDYVLPRSGKEQAAFVLQKR